MDEGNQVFPSDRSAARVVLEFPSFRDFIEAYSPVISQRGMFIRNSDVSQSQAFTVGDRIDFEVRLKDDFRLMKGSGEVVWLGRSSSAGEESGTAVRFDDLDEPSQRLVARLLENYTRDGGKPFDLEAAAESGGAQELEPETLQAAEADKLFAGDGVDVELQPTEIDTVSAGSDEDSPLGPLDQPIGLETIAIPTGLVDSFDTEEIDSPAIEKLAKPELFDDAGVSEISADATLEMPESLLDDVDDSADKLSYGEAPAARFDLAETAEPEKIEEVAFETQGYGSDDSMLLDPEETGTGLTGDLKAAAGGLSDTIEGVPGLSDLPALETMGESESRPFEGAEPVSVGSDADFEEPSEIDGSALEIESIVPDDVARMAEELSGVHRVELPDQDDLGDVSYAGAAKAASKSGVGSKLAIAGLLAVALGAAYYHFGDRLKAMVGLGGSGDGEVVVADIPPASRAEGESTVVPGGAIGDEAESLVEEVGDSMTDPAGGALVGDESTGARVTTPDPAPSSVETKGKTPTPVGAAGKAGSPPPSASQAPKPKPTPPPAGAVAKRPTRPVNRSVSRITRVENVTWSTEGDATVVRIRLDAPISADNFKVERIRTGDPREVIKVLGVKEPYRSKVMEVGSPHVARLRTGLHKNDRESALHIVADLTSAAVAVLSVELKERELKITFS